MQINLRRDYYFSTSHLKVLFCQLADSQNSHHYAQRPHRYSLHVAHIAAKFSW